MKTNGKKIKSPEGGTAWAKKVWEVSWTYIRTVVDTVREPFIILDHNMCVMAANETFYQTFKVLPQDTEGKQLFNLGDGQWNIPTLRKLLEDILPKNTFFRGYEVDHKFPTIGHKIMLLNARQIHQSEVRKTTSPKPIILLVIEDITELTNMAKKTAIQTKEYESKLIGRTTELEKKISELDTLDISITGFNRMIEELTGVVENLKGEIVLLKKRK